MESNVHLINNGDEALLLYSHRLGCKLEELAPILKALSRIKRQRRRREYMKLYNLARMEVTNG